jgi:hypothetical protein
MATPVIAPCKGTTCRGGNPCVCYRGHRAPHICRDPHCACHHELNYGLQLNKRGDKYMPAIAQPAGVTVMVVKV